MSFPKFRMIARMYLDQQQMRIACEHRIRKILEEIPGIEKIDYMKLIKDKKEKLLTELKEKLGVDDLTLELIAIMKTHRDNLYAEEKRLLKDFENVAEDTLIWKWSKNVKGLGPVGCMTFLGFINPDATSAGKIWKYFGYAPDSKLVKGQKANFNREAKGRAWVIATNVIRAGDPYYTCYSEDTRVFTRDGLKYFWELTYNDEIMTLNPLTREIEYQKPKKIFVYDFEGEMIRFEGRFTDLLVTPNHRMVIDCGGRIEFIEAREILRRIEASKSKHLLYKEAHQKSLKMLSNGYKVSEISKILGIPCDTIYGWKYGKKPRGAVGKGSILRAKKGKFRQVRDVLWRGKEAGYIEIPRPHYGGHPGHILNRVPTDIWMRFLGWYLSEGSCFKSKDGGYVIEFGSKEQDVREFEEIIEKLGFKYSKVQFSNVPGIVFYSKQLYEILPKGAKNKHIPSGIKELSPKYLKILLETMIKGDGTHRNGKNVRYGTVSKKLAEDVIEIAIKCGYGVSLSVRKQERTLPKGTKYNGTLYIVGIQKYRKGVTLPRPHTEYYKGKVWCVEVPNHIILVERNGKFAWCGNSLYKAKKKYYLKVRGMEKYIEDPTKCPDYEKCMELLRAKAKRLGRPVKKPPCRAHADNRAKRWLIKLLLSHAWELIRREMGQEIPKHRNYIPPKPHEWWEEIASSKWFQKILRNIETGKLEEVEPPVTLEEIIGEP